MKPWEEYQTQESGPWDDYAEPPEIVEQPETEEPGITAGERGLAAVTGVNTLAPALLGLPMDTYTNAVNLLRAGYGTGKHLLTGSLDVPEMLPGQVGGSEWFKRKIAKGMGGDPFTPPHPEDPTQQNIHMGSGIIAAGALAPTQGVKQTLGTMAKMAPSAGGAIAAKELFPDEPLAPLAGMLAVPTAAAGASALKAKVAPKVSATQAFIKAHKLGYKVPPALAKPNIKQNMIEGAAGTTPTSQKFSLANQKLTNQFIKKDIQYPSDRPINYEGLEAVRKEAGRAYQAAKKAGTFKVDKQFDKEMIKISNQGSAMAKDYPNLVKKDVVAEIKPYLGKKQVSAEGTVEAIKQLRADSSAGYNSPDPAISAMAKAKGKIANELEGLMLRSTQKTNPDLVPELRAARTRIAKTYQIQKALKGENVDAVVLGEALKRGKPMDGLMRDVAEFGLNFPKAAQAKVPQYTSFRPMDYVAGIGGAMVDPVYATALFARPAIRFTIMSKPYQNMLARQAPARMAAIKKLPVEARGAAMVSLLDEIQSQGNSDSK